MLDNQYSDLKESMKNNLGQMFTPALKEFHTNQDLKVGNHESDLHDSDTDTDKQDYTSTSSSSSSHNDTKRKGHRFVNKSQKSDLKSNPLLLPLFGSAVSNVGLGSSLL